MKFDELKVGHLYKGKYIALITSYGAMSYSIKHMWMFDPDNWQLEEIGYIDKSDWNYEEEHVALSD